MQNEHWANALRARPAHRLGLRVAYAAANPSSEIVAEVIADIDLLVAKRSRSCRA